MTARFLVATGIVEPGDLPAGWKQPSPPSQRVVEVTHAIATKRGDFRPVCKSCDFYASIYHKSSTYRKQGIELQTLNEWREAAE